ncbi:streptogrisin D [Actinomadura pelletieri DSM 43383]|uniref:Streptogrisin D n=1 Tax=Actinomadura pelletieri DSM 43383 TaxID=1120940 RepID=A0A495QMS9_9ACTN|nr:S1 family peptidase [Actinomadura pelletieri]RKS74284.1 streptogrisin D [Actinomadura pelletieri DSM 43383]
MNRGMRPKCSTISLLSTTALIMLPALGNVQAAAETRVAPPGQELALRQTALADRITGRLGPRHAGSYVDGAGNLVINVTDAAAARQVTAAGARARLVAHGIRPLTDTKNKLDRLAGTSGTTGLVWGVDVVSNTVVIDVPKTDNDAATMAFVKRARAMAQFVRVRRVAAAPRLIAGPGDAILANIGRCSMSVIAVRGGTEFVVTAGHCAKNATNWTTGDGQTLGTHEINSFPGDDYGTIRVTNPALYNHNAQLTALARPEVGTPIQKKGSTTGTTTGTIIGYERTVNYPEGAVGELIETDACAQPGDSGGSLEAGTLAVGIVSGGTSGGCGGNFRSFFQGLGELFYWQTLTLK